MKKIRLKSHKKLKISTKISIIILSLILSTILFLNYAGNKIFPVIMTQAKIDSKKMAITIIKNSVNDDVLSVLEEDDMFYVIQSNSGEIQSIDFNPVIINRFLNKTTSIVSENLKKIETGKIEGITFINTDDYDITKLKNGVISEIPLGIITNNVLLSNLGPKIPVKINLIGNVVSSVETSISNYGLNSAMIKVYANVEVTEEVIIPFQTEEVKVVNKIPVAIKIVQGKVPEYYSDGKLNSSSNILSIPIEND